MKLEKDKARIRPARNLPEGWHWCEWSDGSGRLMAPTGESYYSYDTEPYGNAGGIEYRASAREEWMIFAGSLEAFQAFAERRTQTALQTLMRDIGVRRQHKYEQKRGR